MPAEIRLDFQGASSPISLKRFHAILAARALYLIYLTRKPICLPDDSSFIVS